MRYHFFEDPGHGWLKVPLKELEELGIAGRITRYSYRRGAYAYLEEDCDAPLFVKAMDEHGQTVEHNTHISNEESRIRDYLPYSYP